MDIVESFADLTTAVQNENGQHGVQYVPASSIGTDQSGIPKEAPPKPVEPTPHRAPSIQGEYRIDHIEIVSNSQPSVLSQPLTDTVAGWSVPSKSATLRLSQVTPGTFTASLRSPELTIKSIDEEP